MAKKCEKLAQERGKRCKDAAELLRKGDTSGHIVTDMMNVPTTMQKSSVCLKKGENAKLEKLLSSDFIGSRKPSVLTSAEGGMIVPRFMFAPKRDFAMDKY